MTDPFVRPDVRAYLDLLAANPRPAFTAEVLAAIRQIPPGAMPSADVPVGDLAVIRDLTLPGPAGDIPVRLFDARSERAPGPVMVFFHGGGFVLGSIDTHAALTAEIARQLDMPVVSVEYRLAPEHPWPAGPDDAEAAARWVAANGAALGRDCTALVLSGDSAGGNLAAVTTLALRDRSADLPVALQLLIYPGVDRRRGSGSFETFSDGYGLDRGDMDLFETHYASDPAHWRASPLLADQQGMPPTIVVTAGLDPLRDEGRAYAAATVMAGVPTIYHEAVGTIHGFASYRGAIPSAREDLATALALTRVLLSGR